MRVCRSRCQFDLQPERSRRCSRRSEAVVRHSRKRNHANRVKQPRIEPKRLNSSFAYLLLWFSVVPLHGVGTTVILILHGDPHPGTVSHSSQWSVYIGERTVLTKCPSLFSYNSFFAICCNLFVQKR